MLVKLPKNSKLIPLRAVPYDAFLEIPTPPRPRKGGAETSNTNALPCSSKACGAPTTTKPDPKATALPKRSP